MNLSLIKYFSATLTIMISVFYHLRWQKRLYYWSCVSVWALIAKLTWRSLRWDWYRQEGHDAGGASTLRTVGCFHIICPWLGSLWSSKIPIRDISLTMGGGKSNVIVRPWKGNLGLRDNSEKNWYYGITPRLKLGLQKSGLKLGKWDSTLSQIPPLSCWAPPSRS